MYILVTSCIEKIYVFINNINIILTIGMHSGQSESI